MSQDLASAFEQFFAEECGVRFVDVTPQVKTICPMKVNCQRTGWAVGETACKGCGLEQFPDED